MQNFNVENWPKAVKQEAARQDLAQLAQSARLQIEKQINKEKIEIENSPEITEWVYEHLPDLLERGCSVFNIERERDVFLTGALPVLSGIFNNITGIYDRRVVNANLFSFVVAPPASGKGVLKCAKDLGKVVHERLLEQNAFALEKYNSDLASFKLLSKAANDFSITSASPIEPVRNLMYIPANSSAASFMNLIQQNDGCGIIFETEADTLTNTLGQDWGNFDDLLRKGFHQETFSYSRKKENEFVEVNRPRMAVVLSGTPGQASRLIVSNENGLFSRFIF